jgi:hypothetical protein
MFAARLLRRRPTPLLALTGAAAAAAALGTEAQCKHGPDAATNVRDSRLQASPQAIYP